MLFRHWIVVENISLLHKYSRMFFKERLRFIFFTPDIFNKEIEFLCHLRLQIITIWYSSALMQMADANDLLDSICVFVAICLFCVILLKCHHRQVAGSLFIFGNNRLVSQAVCTGLWWLFQAPKMWFLLCHT